MSTIIRVSSREICELKELPEKEKRIDTLDGLLDALKSTRFCVLLVLIQSVQWGLCAQMFVMAAYLAPVGNSIGGEFRTIQDEWDDLPVIASIDSSEFVSSATFAGSLALGFLPGVLGDRYGRKPVIMVSLLCIAITGALSSLSPSFLFLVIVRFTQGFFLNSIATVNFVHCMESVAECRRYISACAFGLFWCIGYAIVAPTALLVGSWRWLIGVHSIAALIVGLLLIVCLPESPYYCVSQNNRRKLEDFVKKAEWWNRRVYDVDFEAIMCEGAQSEDQSTSSGTTIIGSLRFIIRNPRLFILLLVEGYTQIATLLAYTGLSIASTALEVGDANWNFVLSGLVELPAYCGVPKLIDWFGSKRVMLVVFIGGSISLIVLKFIGPGIPVLFLIVWLISKFLVTACYFVALIVSSELFPTKCRSFAVAFALTLSNIGSIFGPHVGALNEFWPDLAFIVFGAALAIATVLIAIFIPRNTAFEA
ncbi:hypothetical protein PENTCL1PPCAC_16779 [Pristionchus entomophagus]|uniref:Major facilitator superfamily (MFS) profile domain-containing protein n=1 Tax=Pristionchus entomophagus TaxID=358040 RepID=A0AAV5TJV6_9BILA|nr:hypothetical protein PENTCL1PPCAC_16779 [Pristionchus entomophagus]